MKQLLCLLFLIALCGACARVSKAQNPHSPSAVHVYRISVTHAEWQNDGQGTGNLAIAFTVTHADGTPITFPAESHAVAVSGWSDTDFESSAQHSSTAYYDENANVWNANLPGINPNDKSAHLEFDIKDPATPTWRSPQLSSDIYFANVPIPTQWDTPVVANKTFVTDWGTVVNLNTLSTVKQMQNGQPGTLLNFLIDHTNVPDDTFQLWSVGTYDNGVQVENFNSLWPQGTNPAGISTYATQLITPGSYSDLTFEFTFQEQAYSPSKSIVVTPVVQDLLLANVVPHAVNGAPSLQSSTTINNVHYSLEPVISQWNQGHNYVVWTQTGKDPNVYCRVTKASWTVPQNQANNSWQYQTSLVYGQYWHNNGAMAASSEFGSGIVQNNGTPIWPLNITTQLMTHRQQLLTFHAITIPQSGQLLTLHQSSSSDPASPLKLKSISLNLKSGAQNPNQQVNAESRYMLDLTFNYVDTDDSLLALALVTARDTFNNALNTPYLGGTSATGNPASIDPDQRLFDVLVPIPPGNAKTINLKVLLTADTAAGTSTNISISKTGMWTVVNSDVQPPTAASH